MTLGAALRLPGSPMADGGALQLPGFPGGFWEGTPNFCRIWGRGQQNLLGNAIDEGERSDFGGAAVESTAFLTAATFFSG